jgi:hypothetical protein
MTNTELATTIASLKVQHLACYHTYFSKMSIGSITTGNRLREVHKATDLYLQVLDYYYSIPDAVKEDESPITEDEVLELIAECTKLFNTYQNQYYS